MSVFSLTETQRADVALLERFWSKVDVRGPGECWLWTAGTTHGYGHLKLGGRHVGAHRVMWLLVHGEELESDQYVCHTCDNPPCCNPAHLFLGDALINVQDMMAKGRGTPRQETCLHGHASTEENSIYGGKSGGRACRACRNRHIRECRARKKARVLAA